MLYTWIVISRIRLALEYRIFVLSFTEVSLDGDQMSTCYNGGKFQGREEGGWEFGGWGKEELSQTTSPFFLQVLRSFSAG
jgi:hypothetical protein